MGFPKFVGDRAVTEEARTLLGEIETVAVKDGVTRSAAQCLHPEVAQERIRQAAERAVAVARFSNPNGMQQLGDTNWAQSFESGAPLSGQAGSGTFGLVQSGALESSNVDISKQLVNMIIAQRDFQANAKMISTEDQVTQTIINIR